METPAKQSGSSEQMNYFLRFTTQVCLIVPSLSLSLFTATFLTGHMYCAFAFLGCHKCNLRPHTNTPQAFFFLHKLFEFVPHRCLFLFPAEKCECKEQTLTNSKLFCTMNYAYGKDRSIEPPPQSENQLRNARLFLTLWELEQTFKPPSVVFKTLTLTA